MLTEQTTGIPWKGVGLPALLAIVGFVLAYLLVCGTSTAGSPYSELVLGNKKEVVEHHLENRKKLLALRVQTLKAQLQQDNPKTNDSLSQALALLNKTSKNLYDVQNSNADSGVADWLRFFSLRRELLAAALLDSAPACKR